MLFFLTKDPKTHKAAVHQGAKNRYNLASKILIPQNRYQEARVALEEAAAAYEEVGAKTDNAALHYRLSLIATSEGEALMFLIKSAELWYLHKSDDASRWEQAKNNILAHLKKSCSEEFAQKELDKIVRDIEERMNPILEERQKTK